MREGEATGPIWPRCAGRRCCPHRGWIPPSSALSFRISPSFDSKILWAGAKSTTDGGRKGEGRGRVSFLTSSSQFPCRPRGFWRLLEVPEMDISCPSAKVTSSSWDCPGVSPECPPASQETLSSRQTRTRW